MKKTYQKPVVLIEDFSVTDRFASSTHACGTKATSTVRETCDILDEGFNNMWDRYRMFIAPLSCDEGMYPTNDENCYHSAVLTS